jgi:hypothetical protein
VLILLALLCAACGGGAALSAPWPGHAGDGSGMDYTAASAAVARLNYYRALSGITPVELDYGLSHGCQMHANYLVLNRIDLRTVGLGAHEEDSALAGFSFSGAQAGLSSVIYQGVGPVAAIDFWMQTFYHRLGLLDPNLKRVGFGTHGGYQVLDVQQGRVRGTLAVPGSALYPAPGIIEVPGFMKEEIPQPVPGDNSVGIPVTVEFFGNAGWSITSVTTQLLNLDTAAIVPCYVQTPGSPLLEDWDYAQLIALIPEDPLPRGHYMTNVAAIVDGQPWGAQWDFSVR